MIDNKRQKLEKTLSANQRDQVLFGMARDELGVKEACVKELEASTKMMEKSMKTIAGSIESLGSSLGMGFALLARALGQPSATPETVQSYGNPFQRVVTPLQPRSLSPQTVIQCNSQQRAVNNASVHVPEQNIMHEWDVNGNPYSLESL